MAKIKYLNGNFGFTAYSGRPRFEILSTENGKLTLQFEPIIWGADYTPYTHPYRVVLKTKNAAYETIEDAEQAIAGKITSLKMFNEDGDLIYRAKGLSADLATFHSTFLADDMGGAWREVLSGKLTVEGSNNIGADRWGADVIHAGTGRDKVYALDGNDQIYDLGGRDFYDGGRGFDLLCYNSTLFDEAKLTQGVNADLKAGKVRGPDGKIDKIKSIEGIVGTGLDDQFQGNRKDNDFFGLAGDDLIHGGKGTDTVYYSRDSWGEGDLGIVVDMSAGTVVDGYGDTDTLISIEVIRATVQADSFMNGSEAVRFYGDEGEDTFTISGGLTHIHGEEDGDTFVFLDDPGHTYIYGFETGVDQFQFRAATSLEDLQIIEGDGYFVIAYAGDDSSQHFAYVGDEEGLGWQASDFDWSYVT